MCTVLDLIDMHDYVMQCISLDFKKTYQVILLLYE